MMPVGVARRALDKQVSTGPTIVWSVEGGSPFANHDGDTADYVQVDNTGNETEGTSAARADTTDGGVHQITSTSGLPAYPDDATDVYRTDSMFGGGTGVIGPLYRYQDNNNFWRVRIRQNDEFNLQKKDGGSLSNFAEDTTVTINADTVYTTEWDPTAGGTDEFVVRLYEGGIDGTEISSHTSDTTLSGTTGIGCHYDNIGQTADYTYHDYWRIA